MNLEINYHTKVKPTNEELDQQIMYFIAKNPKGLTYLSDSFQFCEQEKNLNIAKNEKIKAFSNDKQEINILNMSSKVFYYKI